MTDTAIVYGSCACGVRQQPPVLRVYRSRIIRTADGQAVRSGGPEPFWAPLSLRWRSNGEISTLTLKRALGRGGGQAQRRAEDVPVAAGDRFRLVEVLLSQFARAEREWFRGHLSEQEVLVQAAPGGDAETLRATVCGPELILAQKVVLGQWLKTPQRDAQEVAGTLTAADAVRSGCWQSHLPCVLNAEGKANASASAWKLDSDDESYAATGEALACRVFEPPGRTVRDADGEVLLQAQYWTAYTALRSLIEWVDAYETISYERTNWQAIESLLGDVRLGEVRLHGMNLLEAMAAILLPVGFGFAVEPWAEADRRGRFAHRLRVYSLSDPAERKSPPLADNAAGNVPIGSAAGRRAAVQRLHLVRGSRDAVGEIHVLGDQKRVQIDLDFGGSSQGSWELQPYWDTSENDLDYWLRDGEFNPRHMPGGSYTYEAFCDQYDLGGSDYERNRHVFRSFAWNEDGALAPVITAVPDLSDYGDDEQRYVRRPRPVGETYTYDHDKCLTRRMPASVWLALVRADNGSVDEASWLLLPAQVWRDRAGLTLDVAELADWYPWAHHETLAGQDVAGDSYTKYQDLHYLTLLARTLEATGGTKLLLRLSGSVETDATVTAVGAAAQAAPWPFPAQRAVYLPHRFQWRQRQETGVWGASLPADARDDRAEASAYAARLACAAATGAVRCGIVLRYLTREYAPGVGVPRTADRQIRLAADGDAGCPIVAEVAWNFADSPGKTELALRTPPRSTP